MPSAECWNDRRSEHRLERFEHLLSTRACTISDNHMPDLLEFEEPIGVLLKEIEALSMLPRTPERERSIDVAAARAPSEIRGELYANLTPWQRVLVARHPARPNTLDYVERLFTGFDELHGDRRFADDHAIVSGLAELQGPAGRRRRASEGPRHQAEDLPQLRLRPARRLSQGAARDAAGAEVQPPDRRLHRHAGGVSRRRVGRARRRRGDRLQPARDDHARSARSSSSSAARAAAAARSASPSATAC